MKVDIYTHDGMLTLVRTKEYCDDMFGEDYFDEDSIEVPDDLAIQLMDAYQKVLDLSREVETIQKKLQQSR